MHNKLMVLYVLDMAQTHNPNIGKYLKHKRNESNGYTVVLNNGSIEIPADMVQDMDRHIVDIDEDRVAPIALGFREKVIEV